MNELRQAISGPLGPKLQAKFIPSALDGRSRDKRDRDGRIGMQDADRRSQLVAARGRDFDAKPCGRREIRAVRHLADPPDRVDFAAGRNRRDEKISFDSASPAR
jgi:hypothetical protein